MDTVVIYPGRFHPFHKGHKSVYDTLVKRFGNERVFIATSAKVDPPKSPFTFEEKRAMIALTGIDPSRVIQTKSPYQATEITDNYDPKNTPYGPPFEALPGPIFGLQKRTKMLLEGKFHDQKMEYDLLILMS